MALYECILKKGILNGKNGRFLGGWRILVSRPHDGISGSDIEKEMIRQFGDDAKGCGYKEYWEIKKIN